MGKKTVVFGSFVVDLMGRTPHLPAAGETVKGSVFKMGPGGKGFNQGVAAHKAGADVTMVTKLGRDSFADIALSTMKELGMSKDRILFSENTETGCALILVDENSSQNEIVVILGACNTITDAEVDSLGDLLDGAEYLLTQLETNVSATERVVDMACKKGVKVILNTAPVQPISDELLSKVDLITPNEVEAEILTGIKVDSEEAAGSRMVLCQRREAGSDHAGKQRGLHQYQREKGHSSGLPGGSSRYDRCGRCLQRRPSGSTGRGQGYLGGGRFCQRAGGPFGSENRNHAIHAPQK